MDAVERIEMLDSLLHDGKPMNYEKSDKILAIRDQIKVSDLFFYAQCSSISAKWAEEVLGFKVVYGSKICEKLEAAYKAGWVEPYTIRRHGHDIYYYRLSDKAQKLLNWQLP